MQRFVWALLVQAACAQVVYDAYFGKPISDARRGFLEKQNATGYVREINTFTSLAFIAY